MQKITIIRPDDFHIHLRDGEFLDRTVADCSSNFHRAIAMPNLKIPVTTLALARAYRERILSRVPAGVTFKPLMTLYLTDSTTPEGVKEAKESGEISAYKLYPSGATTNSDAGVTSFDGLFPVFEMMQEVDIPLLIHGEVTDKSVDIFDREQVFIEKYLSRWTQKFPKLRIVLEHISTAYAADFIADAPANIAATITPHHLLLNRNALLAGGMKPYNYCLPVIKKQSDQEALIRVATSGNKKFFLGTDSAPHGDTSKLCSCASAGIYNATTALSIYAKIFEQAGALDKLENFASVYGANFYGLPVNNEKITLIKEPWTVPKHLPYGDEVLTPLCHGDVLDWQVG